MKRASALSALVALLAQVGCGAGSHGSAFDGGAGADDGGGTPLGGQDGALSGSDGSAPGDGGAGVPGTLAAVVRDFRFYDAGDPTTVPDFENPPYGIDQNGNPSSGYAGPWDDHQIVAATLGGDGKPVYANPTGTTLTTHGKADFDRWYRDVPGTNIHVDYPLPISQMMPGVYGYDSEQSGIDYDSTNASAGKGFFPIDDSTPYKTAFGDQGTYNGTPHNYSFTMELHTSFVYRGGEYFHFRGDDDVWVFIDGKLVINLGGIHSPETAQVDVDTLGLIKGQTYPLDFFSAERHVTGSNILFQTTLQLQPPVQ